jgi:hypothetical protein
MYRAVRGLVYIVQIVPNCPANHSEYKVTGSLLSFTIYSYFCVEPIHGRHVSPAATPLASNLQCRDIFATSTTVMLPSIFYPNHSFIDNVGWSRPSSRSWLCHPAQHIIGDENEVVQSYR